MLNGAYSIPRVKERSDCMLSEDTKLWDTDIYKIYANTFMHEIDPDTEKQQKDVDETIFINDEETKSQFQKKLECQNFLSTKYIGSAPLEYYGGNSTPKGTKFRLICEGGNPNAKFRRFGTEEIAIGTNKTSEDSTHHG